MRRAKQAQDTEIENIRNGEVEDRDVGRNSYLSVTHKGDDKRHILYQTDGHNDNKSSSSSSSSPLALQPAVGFGLSNNIPPFFPICHQLFPSSHS
jgi:hypothetical protein